ncbi:ELMO/CED-12 family [Carpediemonas membranifera]|uniref:ELMO/CED-12 family n=1 Tax=Carpediemonas membranifera TaxID=201153 RepID=A0A8J6B9T4_9EUKA|nr:ELMO/CED-12 family [Carpediemonas membranifera]|eukprot:KAG9397159.1 ELMO/CED-12 family [Carpediemonas membranifera]
MQTAQPTPRLDVLTNREFRGVHVSDSMPSMMPHTSSPVSRRNRITIIRGKCGLISTSHLNANRAGSSISLQSRRLQPCSVAFPLTASFTCFLGTLDDETIANHVTNAGGPIYPVRKCTRAVTSLVGNKGIPLVVDPRLIEGCYSANFIIQAPRSTTGNDRDSPEYENMLGTVVEFPWGLSLVIAGPDGIMEAVHVRLKAVHDSELYLRSHAGTPMALSDVPFDPTNPVHTALMDRVYDAVYKKPAPSLSHDSWVDLGFQRPNPTSDFRGGGILGLLQLVYVLERSEEAVTMVAKGMRVFEQAVPVPLCAIDIAHRLRDFARSVAVKNSILVRLANKVVRMDVEGEPQGLFDLQSLLSSNETSEEDVAAVTDSDVLSCRPALLEAMLQFGAEVVNMILVEFETSNATIHQYNTVLQSVIGTVTKEEIPAMV